MIKESSMKSKLLSKNLHKYFYGTKIAVKPSSASSLVMSAFLSNKICVEVLETSA